MSTQLDDGHTYEIVVTENSTVYVQCAPSCGLRGMTAGCRARALTALESTQAGSGRAGVASNAPQLLLSETPTFPGKTVPGALSDQPRNLAVRTPARSRSWLSCRSCMQTRQEGSSASFGEFHTHRVLTGSMAPSGVDLSAPQRPLCTTQPPDKSSCVLLVPQLPCAGSTGRTRLPGKAIAVERGPTTAAYKSGRRERLNHLRIACQWVPRWCQ